MTERAPGFYLKYVICDEHDRPIVHSEPVRVLTAREFYDQRFIPAHVANTYASFAAFMAQASMGVNLFDALTTFSRSNYVARPPLRWQIDAIETIANEVRTELSYVLDKQALSDLANTLDKEVASEMQAAIGGSESEGK